MVLPFFIDSLCGAGGDVLSSRGREFYARKGAPTSILVKKPARPSVACNAVGPAPEWLQQPSAPAGFTIAAGYRGSVSRRDRG